VDHPVGAQAAYITPGSPRGNGYIESFNPRLRDEFLNGEIFYSIQEAKVLFEARRRQYNTVRPHSSLGYRPPAPEVLLWPPPATTSKGAVRPHHGGRRIEPAERGLVWPQDHYDIAFSGDI
jgi:hypothetical protein